MAEGLENLTVAQQPKNPNGPLQTFLGSWGPHWTPRVGRFEVSFPRHRGAPKWKFGWAPIICFINQPMVCTSLESNGQGRT